ncbi:hypothetical protein QAD02_011754 [Eretmocerus hayati]|uniref:Uncharacterized protein n=1 Tax=Eretmocerus hayati TaxID=131215 RepID=A0ACC2NXM5_9HYME|nr:hypothetical protein QAD02_011754 [Eretmocerus hayati]
METETAKIPEIEEDIRNLKDSAANDLLEVNNRLDELENAGNQSSSEAVVDAIASEIQDRNSRLNNIILYRIPKNSTSDPSADLLAVKNILKKEKDVQLANVSIRRIGLGVGTDKPRPNVAASTDRTKAQRDKLSSIRAEVERINKANGSRCKTIKYIGGVPTIVDYTEPPVSASTTTSARATTSGTSHSGNKDGVTTQKPVDTTTASPPSTTGAPPAPAIPAAPNIPGVPNAPPVPPAPATPAPAPPASTPAAG